MSEEDIKEMKRRERERSEEALMEWDGPPIPAVKLAGDGCYMDYETEYAVCHFMTLLSAKNNGHVLTKESMRTLQEEREELMKMKFDFR
jgi:hypothetical protein